MGQELISEEKTALTDEPDLSDKNLIYQRFENKGSKIHKLIRFFKFSFVSSALARNMLQFLSVAILSFVLLLLFSVSTTPLYDTSTYMFNDSNFFQVVGKIIAEGGTPYIDFFDHKGIYFFWYQALCYLIHPTWGCFIGEWIIYSISFYCLFKIFGVLKLSDFTALLSAVIYIFFTCFIREGNTTEDFSLLFITPALLIYLKATESDSKPLFITGNILCGAGAGVLIFVRLTNAVPLFFLVLFYAVHAIRKKRYKDLIINFFSCLIPLVITCLIPLFVAYQGGYLTEMIDQTFLMNIEYSTQHFNIERFALMMTDVLITILLSYKLIKLRRERSDVTERDILLLLIISIIGNGVIFAYFSTYPHYYIVVYPSLITSIAIFIERIYRRERKSDKPGIIHDNKSLLSACALTLIASISTLGDFIYYYTGYNTFFSAGKDKSLAFQELLDDIDSVSEDEDPEILTIDVNPGFWLYTDEVPDYPNFAFQSWQNETEDDILPDMEEYIRDERPEWIIIDDSDPFALNNISDDNLIKRKQIIDELPNYGYELYDTYFINDDMEDVYIDDVKVVDHEMGLAAFRYVDDGDVISQIGMF